MNGDASGFDIKLLSQRTGLAEDKLWQILTRNRDLREMPYSVKAGKGRVFFPPIVEWLAHYEGISDIPDKAVRDVRLPSGPQLARLESIYGKAGAGLRLDNLMGWAPVTAIAVPSVMPGADRAREIVAPAVRSPDPVIERKLGFIREKFYAKRDADRRRDRLQIRLPGMGA